MTESPNVDTGKPTSAEIEKAFNKSVCSEWLKQLSEYEYKQVMQIFEMGAGWAIEQMKRNEKGEEREEI